MMTEQTTKTEQALRSDLEDTLMKLKALTGYARATASGFNNEVVVYGEHLWGIFSAIDDIATTAQAQFYETGKTTV